MRRFIFILFLCVLPVAISIAREVRPKENVDQIIDYLLDYVARSECIFIRNGKTHDAKKASRHMKRKYKHFEDEISSPEDFIRLAGTKSTMSGKPYMVRLKNGKEMLCSDWLGMALTEYRASLVESNDTYAHKKLLDNGKNVMVDGGNSFAIEMYKELMKNNENMLLSPFSLYNALAMAAEGARDETAFEFGVVLHFPDTLKSSCKDIPWNMSLVRSSLSCMSGKYECKNDFETKERINELEKVYFDSIITTLDNPGGMDTAECYYDIMMKERNAYDELTKARENIPHYEFRLANAAWVQKDFDIRDDYTSVVNRYYADDGVFSADFINNFTREQKRINSWIENRTRGRIKRAFAISDPSRVEFLRLVLVNAVYFLGEWQQPFDEKYTKQLDFRLDSGEKIKTAMMRVDDLGVARYGAFNADGSIFQTPREIEYGQTVGLYPGADGFAVLEMPYKNSDLAMLVLSPNSPDGLPRIESQLTHKQLLLWVNDLRNRKVHVVMPKFRMDHEYHLVPVLMDLGLKLAFDDQKADLSGISEIKPGKRLYVSDVFQKAFLEVDERGTEAAVASVVNIEVTSSMRRDKKIQFVPTFRADRPFLFLVRDTNSGLLLFMGRLVNPDNGEKN